MNHAPMSQFRGGAAHWNAMIAGLPGGHLLQSWEWAQVKQAYGWQPMPLIWEQGSPPEATAMGSQGVGAVPAAAVMVLKRQIISRGLAAHLSIMYAPKGPVLDWSDAPLRERVLGDLARLAKSENAIFVKIDPDVVLGRGLPGAEGAPEEPAGASIVRELQQRGWRFSTDQIQFRNTVLIELSSSEEALLARMKQKTRYNIRLAEKKGVVVRSGSVAELPNLYKMYAETSARDAFVIRDERYYRTVWQTFLRPWTGRDQPCAEVLIAEVAGAAVAAIFVFYFADRAYYIYGMSRQDHRDKMPNYLLQWEGIRRAKARGCTAYDLWGAPDVFEESDPMWGVFRFKDGLGGELVRTIGAWDLPASPFWYPAYTRVLPRLLDVMRARGKHKTRRDLAAT
jgi:lipid II:glycine glycyltransferase (peptidoglycan interpeptide bridge formation enzyme)